MKNFNSTENAAIASGVSLRHFKRLADELGLRPVVGGSSGRPKFFWTPDQIEQVRILWTNRHGASLGCGELRRKEDANCDDPRSM